MEIFTAQGATLVPLTLVANLSPVLLIPGQYATSVVDTGGKFAASMVDNGGKFAKVGVQMVFFNLQISNPQILGLNSQSKIRKFLRYMSFKISKPQSRKFLR